MDSNGDESKPARYTKDPNEETLVAKTEQELQLLTLVHNSLLQVLEPGIIILDGKRTIITENESVARMWGLTKRLTGQQFEESELAQRCPDLKQQLDASVEQNAAPARFKFQSTPEIVIAITIRPIRSESGVGRVGTLIYFEDVTPREVLQGTIEALQTTTEELQSANEELETTNEELQSTNEELETTNEELQSSNEELETTNEELQSLNEELETTNEELAVRTREVDEMNVRYKEMLERMPWPVLLVSPDLRIYVWSSAAQGLLGFAIPSEKGMAILELPISMDLKELLIRRHQSVLKSNEPSVIRNQSLAVGREFAQFDIHVSPLSADDLEHGVLLMFERLREVSKEAPKKKLQASLASKKKISLKKAARKKKKS
jgi:two-component system CheB/CheR fusion protein